MRRKKHSVIKRVMRVLVGVTLAVAWSAGHANLVIQITQGNDRAFPMVMVPFNTAVKNAQVPQGMSAVIQQDLHSSGEFNFAQEKKAPQEVHDFQNIDWKQWAPLGKQYDYLLIGNIKAVKPGQYQVSFELVSLLAHKMLMGKSYKAVSGNQLRALAHHISDEVYQFVTGKQGNFSTRLAYVAVQHAKRANPTYELVVSDADGFAPHVLLKQVGVPIASPAWSPDGKQLAYVSYLNNRMVVYAIQLATGKRDVVADFDGMNSAPAWSPDGQKMALALSKKNSAQTNIYVLNLNSHKLQQITHLGTNTSPHWSHDGKSIVFTSNRIGNPQIYEWDFATKQVTRITYQGQQNFSAEFSPDDQSLIVMHQQSRGGPIRIGKYSFATGEIVDLTKGELDKSPSVSPNGQMVIYANYDGAHGILAEVSINGKVQLKLPSTQGSVQSPAWSPFLH